MKRIVLAIFLLGLFNHLYSQEREITITVVDTCGKPIPRAIVYLSNDSLVMTYAKHYELQNADWLHSRVSNFESQTTWIDGKAKFSGKKYTYAHALLFGYQSKTILIDFNKINYTIKLPERAYDFSTLIISRKNFAIDWNWLEMEYGVPFVDYEFKHNTFDTIGGMVYEVETPRTPENIVDSICGWGSATFTYPDNGTKVFFKNLATKLRRVRLEEMVFDFTVTDADSIRVNRIEGIDNKKYPWIKEMFINLDSWESAKSYGKKIAVRYTLKVIKSDKKLTIDPSIHGENSRTVINYHQ